MNTYNADLATLAEDFINTYDTFLDEPEHLLTPADLARFLEAHAIAAHNVTEKDLAAARVVRTQLRAAWNAKNNAEAANALNPLLAQTPLQAQVIDAADALHIQLAVQGKSTLAQQLGAQAALGIAGAIQQHGLERLRACASEPCRDVFIDVSRNKSRRFCSERCANRYNVAQFRGRQQPD